jgi:hypothetical protein
MRKLIKAMTAVAFAAGVAVTAGATDAQAAGGTYEGCPYTAVCVYPQDAGWNGGNPSLIFYSYGAHNLSGQYGNHILFNNQSGGATAQTCTGYDGVGCQGYLKANTYMTKDLTPINSIKLTP